MIKTVSTLRTLVSILTDGSSGVVGALSGTAVTNGMSQPAHNFLFPTLENKLVVIGVPVLASLSNQPKKS